MAKSIRQIAKETGVSHSTISRIMSGKYKADSKHIVEKVLRSMGGVGIPTDKYQDILDMLNAARFPQKFAQVHRTAGWLYDLIINELRSNHES